MKRFGWFAVVLVIVVAARFMGKGDASKDALGQMQGVIQDMPVYEANAAFLDESLSRHHERAFDAAYNMGTRRRSGSLNEDKYLTIVLNGMIEDCERDERADAAGNLASLRGPAVEAGDGGAEE